VSLATTLVDVAMLNRSLADMTRRFGIAHDEITALADAVATAAVVCTLAATKMSK
jgi:hypothetical protein